MTNRDHVTTPLSPCGQNSSSPPVPVRVGRGCTGNVRYLISVELTIEVAAVDCLPVFHSDALTSVLKG